MLRQAKRQLENHTKPHRSRLPPLSKSVEPNKELSEGIIKSEVKSRFKIEEKNINETGLGYSLAFPRNQYLPHSRINKGSFDFLIPVGRGAYGKVWKVMHRKSGAVYAVKQMSRSLYSSINPASIAQRVPNPS